LPAVLQSVEQEVVTPDVILTAGDRALLPCAASSAPLACPDGDLESFIAADPAHSFAIDEPPLSTKFGCKPAMTVARRLPGEMKGALSNPFRLIARLLRAVACVDRG